EAAANAAPALVALSATTVRGMGAAAAIELPGGMCAPDRPRAAALCFAGWNVVVDPVVRDGWPGGVRRSVGLRVFPALRVAVVEMIERSSMHDNRTGGILLNFGGHALVAENVVQHNLPGASQNGITVAGGTASRSMLVTDGNVVRFSGQLGLHVTNNATALF